MDAAQLDRALAIAEAAADVREAAALLRQAFGPLRVLVVDALDLRDETPAARGRRCLLFLGATDGHCWRMTDDPAAAAALFVAACGDPNPPA